MPNDFYNAIQQLRRNRAQEADTPQGIQTPELDKATGNTAQSAPALQISPRWKSQGQSQQPPRGMETYSPIMLAMQNPNAAIPTEQQWNARQNVGQTQTQPTQTQSTGSTGSRPGGRGHQRRTSTQAVNLAGETQGQNRNDKPEGRSPASATGRYDPDSTKATGTNNGVPVLTSYDGFKRLDQGLSNSVGDPEGNFFTLARARDIGEAALTGTAAGYTGAARAGYEAGQKRRDRENQEMLAELEPELARQTERLEYFRNNLGEDSEEFVSQQNLVNNLQLQVDAMRKVVNENLEQRATQAASELTHELEQKSSAATERAREGTGKIGQIAVDAAINMLQMGGDALAGVATGGSSLLPMGVRVFGQGASEAEQAGADINRQVLFATTAAGIEVFTEKLFDGVAQLYGKGAADEITEAVVGKLARTDTGRTALRTFLGMNEEGLEEVISDVLSPAAQMIYNGKSIGESYKDNFSFSNTLYDYLVGAAAAGGMNAVRPRSFVQSNQQANAELRANEAEEQRRTEEEKAREIEWREFFRQGPNQQTQARTEEGGQSSQTRQTAERGQTEGITSEDVRRQQEEAARQREGQPVIETGERTPAQETRREPTPGTNPRADEQTQLEESLNTPQAAESAENTEGQAGTSPIAEAILQRQRDQQDNRGPRYSPREYEALQEEYSRRLGAFNDANDRGDPDYNYREEARWLDQAQRTIQQNQAGYYAALAEERIKSKKKKGAVSEGYGTPENHIAARSADEVGDLTVKAFQFDHPELHPYFLEAAREAIDESATELRHGPLVHRNSQKETFSSEDTKNPLILYLRRFGLTRKDMYDALDNIIRDMGSENTADSKRAELFLHNRLMNGYMKTDGTVVPPNQAYIDALRKIPGGQDVQWQNERNAFEFGLVDLSEDEAAAELQRWDAEHPRPSTQSTPQEQTTPAQTEPEQTPPTQNPGTQQTGTVRSQSEANTIQAIDRNLDTPQEVRNPLYYNLQSEAESVSRARDFLQNGYTSNAPAQVNTKLTPEQHTSLQDAGNRLGGGYGQAMSDMQGSSVWSTVQQDMSTLIFDALAEDAQRTGNWDAYEAWRIVDQEHGTEIARTLQARGKRTRGAKYDILDYVSNVINEAGLSEDAKNAALTKTLQYARKFQTLDETDENALKDFIRRASQARGTGTIIKPALNKLLKGQSAEYLYKIAEAQCKAMANDFMPVSVGDKLKTWQTIAQLLKVTTAARNLGGNELFGLMDSTAGNIFGVALDRLVAKSTGARSVAMDTRWLNSAQRKAAVDAAKKSALEIALDVDIGSAGNKYDPRGRSYRMSGNVMERFMSRLEQLLSYSLTTSDQFFRGGIEANAAALDRLNAGNEAALAQSREAMENMADYRLFQNKGAAATVARTFHDALNMAGIGGEVKNGKRTGGFGVADAIMPYTTVPANLAVKPFEWSPVGIVRGGVELAQVLKDAKNGKLNLSKQNDAVMSIARGASGTAVVALLAALIKSGIVKRSDDDKDYDVTKARQAEGRTETQWNLDATLRWLKGGSRDWKESDDLISLNWAEPMNAFMDIAALAVDAQEDGDAAISDYASAYAYGAIQAFMEMPMMETMQTITNAVKYADAGDMDKVGNALQSAAISATTGMMPGAVSQMGRVIDPVTRDTAGDTFLERFTNAIMNATPGLREKLPEKLDSFGNPIVAENPLYNALNNLALPGAVREYAPKDIVQALDSVYDETGGSTFYPDYKAPNAFSYGGTNYELTTEEKRAYMTAFGESYNKLMEDTLNSRQYDRMSASEKAEVFGNLRTLAMNQARGEIVEGRGGQYETDKDGILELSNIPSYYMNKAQYSAAIQNKDYDQIDKMIKSWNGVPDDVAEKLTSGTGPMHYLGKVYEASKAGINSKTYYETTDAVKAIPSAGKGDDPLTWQKVEYIGNLRSMSEKQKDFFMKQYFEGGTVTKYETCRSQGYRPQDIAAFYKLKSTIKGDDNNGDGKADSGSAKAKTIAAAVKYGFSQAQAEYLWKVWSSTSK